MNMLNEQDQKEKLVDRALKALHEEYFIVGRTHVRAWYAWLAIGMVAGVTIGIILIANKSGEFEATRAQGNITRFSGRGNVNYVSKFTGSDTIGNSLIFDNGTNVVIGNPNNYTGAKLDVFGSLNIGETVGPTCDAYGGCPNELRFFRDQVILIPGPPTASGPEGDFTFYRRDVANGEVVGAVSGRGNTGVGNLQAAFQVFATDIVKEGDALSEHVEIRAERASPFRIFTSAGPTGTIRDLKIQRGNVTQLQLRGGGLEIPVNVGIGNPSPVTSLQVGASGDTIGKKIRVSSDSGDMTLLVYGSMEEGYHAGIGRGAKIIGQQGLYPMVISNNAAQPIIFGTNDTERMRIVGNGNVGIGAANPSQKLEVNGNISVKNGVMIRDKITNAPYCISVSNGQLQAIPGGC